MCFFLDDPDPEGQGFCQAGFSVDFTKVRIAATIVSYCHDNPSTHLVSSQNANREVSANTSLPTKIYRHREDEIVLVPRGASTPNVTHRI